jgi:hypothetical protein
VTAAIARETRRVELELVDVASEFEEIVRVRTPAEGTQNFDRSTQRRD